MDAIVFPNDDNVILMVPCDPTSYFNNYKVRPYHESLFRNITKYLIKNKLIKGNIIDLGAWIGDNAAPWAKMQRNTIYAIDPSVDNCKYITAISRLNNLDNLRVIQSAMQAPGRAGGPLGAGDDRVGPGR